MSEIKQNVSLKPFNTFQIDARAAYFCEIHSVTELQQLIKRLDEFPRFLVLGGGSNLLFCGDYNGLVIHNCITGHSLAKADGQQILTLGSGENWHEAVQFSVGKGLYGIENLALIPGTAGAAPIQNIGAYGVELKDVFRSLTAVDLSNGSLREFSLAECRFAYRDSIFKQEAADRYCITSVTLNLSTEGQVKTAYGEIEAEIERRSLEKDAMTPKDMSEIITAIRQRKLPDPAENPNAGSFFKNPVVPREQAEELKARFPGLVSYPLSDHQVKLASGWLIDNLGWKGRSLNGARVHDRQALVLVNEGGGAPAVKALAERIQREVADTYGVKLEPEPRWVE
ncbi:MAG: UDP-N-acetylmuramate dehydrogenase [Ketobacteraceae bacterium]|nr:UDP-N-acetylmuramate dehydrogenase [Ketobacteraceae bacterium]